ncbi:MAG: hypothetical protein ABI806_27385 [Candidatus Solibacter sp.]
MTGLAGLDDLPKDTQFFRATGAPAGDWFACREHLRTLPESAIQQALSGLPTREVDQLSKWLRDYCPKWAANRYSAYFRELDAWTEYWDVYHPETHGRYYFGDDEHPGLLTAFLPSPANYRNPVFDSWKMLALQSDSEPDPVLLERFTTEARRPHVAEAVLAVDELVLRLVRQHFADPAGEVDAVAYLDAMERFGRDTLPACPERYARIPAEDGRKSSSLHHTIEGHVMWFAWAVHLICAQLVARPDPEAARLRRLLLAGTALGCSFDFVFRGRCRTREQYLGPDGSSKIWVQARASQESFELGSREMLTLFRIREYGE